MNRNKVLITGLMSGLILLPFIYAGARNGGGRGGSVGGVAGPVGVGGLGSGAYRGGQNLYRVPTMSRASMESLPVRHSQVAPQSVSPPSVNRPAVTSGRLPAQTQFNRNQANQVLQQSRTRTNNQNVINARQNAFNNTRADVSRSGQLNAQRVSSTIQNERGNTQWFNQGFFRDHNIAPLYQDSGINVWRPTNWNALNSWLPYGWNAPIYYDEAGYPITVSQTTTSTDTSPIASSPQAIQSQGTSGQIAQGEWMPLGVFIVSPDANLADMSSMIMQLALDKKGQLSGTYYNKETDKAVELVGYVDNTTQQAAWQVAGRSGSPFMFTGLYNLTQDETPVMLHFSDGSEQPWIMTRLQN